MAKAPKPVTYHNYDLSERECRTLIAAKAVSLADQVESYGSIYLSSCEDVQKAAAELCQLAGGLPTEKVA